ncbi:MAG TPA: ubiquinone/menaquinone biosynthesis methyltransferase, partial [Anaeromyxobacter sp.]
AAAADVSLGSRALDVCTGTGDLAFELARRVGASGAVIGVDFSEQMLERAREKGAARGSSVDFRQADALELPFTDDAFDAATVAFGARNLADLDQGLAEMARVVRPGGTVVVLDITAPRRLRALHGLWFDRLVPRVGALVGRDGAAYGYLPASAKRFPQPEALAELMADAGLEGVRHHSFLGGIVAMHHGRVTR